MRLIVLTTGSVRRRHFVRALQCIAPVTRAFIETGKQVPPDDTFHSFERKSKDYEKSMWFNGRPPPFEDIVETQYFPCLNNPNALHAIAETRSHMMLVFGTRKLSQSVIDICPSGAFNIHTGDPERYRGLDAHLWAIYQGDFDAVSVAMHRLTAELDGGETLATRRVPINPEMSLFQLRRASTDVAIDLTRQALVEYQTTGGWHTRHQKSIGHYYSFMSSESKEICVQRFAQHTARL
ncbi:MAG: formyltransferase family protein [Gammaproteobacteria bacterium]|nr:formyltransferase family protein [Gammaproteobacteria bacterium]